MPPQPGLQVVVRLREIVSPPGIRAKTRFMRFARSLLAVTPFLLLAAAAPANAAVSHTVQPGETLWSIAAANNLTTRTVAAFNGLPETANVVLGSTINVPTTVEGASALQAAGVPLAGAAPQAAAAPAAAPSTGAPPPAGSYVVRAGDTLSGLAANAGVATSQIAAANGLDPSGPLLTGTVLKLPSGAPAPPRSSQPLPSQRVVPAAAPAATAARLGAGDIQSVASANGVSPSLAAAIAWQESGFNNGMVSSANARGVMQVMPGTWSFVEQNLAGRRLDANSATDNVRAGVLYLGHLLKQTGGDESAAIAGYYQGLGSVRSRGQFDDTQKYVANVQALRSRFGG
jgi:soluble lytic murein transglycosylase-like protein